MEYKLVISGPIGAGKSTLLESITQYLRMHDYKVGCVREFIDSHSDGSKKLADWISGKISLLDFQNYISDCHIMDNEKIKDCPVKVYERTPYESALIFCNSTYCFKEVMNQANEVHQQYGIPYPNKKNEIIIDANRSAETVFETLIDIVDKDLVENIEERYVYLMVNVETSMSRIKARGRVSELSYSEGYLQNIIDAYNDVFIERE